MDPSPVHPTQPTTLTEMEARIQTLEIEIRRLGTYLKVTIGLGIANLLLKIIIPLPALTTPPPTTGTNPPPAPTPTPSASEDHPPPRNPPATT